MTFNSGKGPVELLVGKVLAKHLGSEFAEELASEVAEALRADVQNARSNRALSLEMWDEPELDPTRPPDVDLLSE